MTPREIFLRYIAQTSPSPMALHITRAEGCLLYDASGKEYLDLIGGISVANVGHRHPTVVAAIKTQVDAYLHIMVYGEFIETPQVAYASLLVKNLPATLDTVYFTNSGAEAVEGAMKLAKRFTGRTDIIAFNRSYHGSTQGALSILGDEYFRNAFRPLLPGISHFDYGDENVFTTIDSDTACVVLEPLQAEAGIIQPQAGWLKKLRKRCDETGALLVFDEIQSGFGRTGKLWAFENSDVVPDILLLGKALGGGMPLGAFIAGQELMSVLAGDPVLGHITTFGGHPVSCAAGHAAMEVLIRENLMESIDVKEKLFRSLLVHPKIIALRSCGLWLALEVESFETNKKLIDYCLAAGLLTDWFLFAPQCLRISPPLTITNTQVENACRIILDGLSTI
jgi:acetylornithine/succinyldiaminopimelate/putrescine aminotransferase